MAEEEELNKIFTSIMEISGGFAKSKNPQNANEPVKKKNLDNIKIPLVKFIESMDFPIGFVRGEADGSYGILVYKNKIKLIGYAIDFYEKTPKKLIDLFLADLAFLIEQGVTSKTEIKDLEDTWAEENEMGEGLNV
jgi:hypothetical protein